MNFCAPAANAVDYDEGINSNRYSIYHPLNGSTCMLSSFPSITILFE